MKFNMGCGRRKLDGYVNVDSWPGCEPDEVWDLEQTPWPWPSDSASDVLFNHALEHIGAAPAVFLAIMAELYRICRPDGLVQINVPHPRHDNFLGDPTHVRPITPQVLSLFDKSLNDEWVSKGAANTPLAHHTGVDFRISATKWILEPAYSARLQSGELNNEEINTLVRERYNIVREIQITLRAVKTA